jgi:hypothetical protein
MMKSVTDRCRRHASLLDAFFDERERLVLGVPRLRRRDSSFDTCFREAESRVLADGVPPMFTLRPALRELERRGDASRVVAGLAGVADRANVAICALVEDDWPPPASVGWSGAFAAVALVAHADDAPDVRRAAIDRLRVGVDNGSVEPRRFAHVVDRDAAMRGRDQIYGTLFVPIEGDPQPLWPMPAERTVDDARRMIGLPSLSADRTLYQSGARPGPFLAPATRQDAALVGARLTASYLRHGTVPRRFFD